MTKYKYPDIRKGLHFIPLGGCEQFGVNLNVYTCDGKLLAVDCGLGFADERFPGIDLLLPDPQFLEDNKDKLEGLIITHAHEDHIGAVPYIWRRFRCPIYISAFGALVLKEKFKEAGIRNAKVHIIDTNDTVQIGAFSVQPIHVTHSVPDTQSLAITTQYGTLIHSGDWNLDPKPVIGEPTDVKTFKQFGKKGVLAYIGDSTNAGVNGRSGSESEVEKGLAAEFKNCKEMIAVTIFSSNISRVISIARAAENRGRSIVLVGRSLLRMVSCAQKRGLLDDVPEFLTEGDLKHLSRDQIVLVVTGSQGEGRAALARIARGEHRNITMRGGDTVIFSARAIPGNDRNINEVKNNLSAGNIRIITPDDTSNTIHVSGHPCADEISDMLQWVKPKTLIPVHGERMQLDEQAALARQHQIENVIVPINGSIIKLAPGTPQTIDHIETGLLAVDQKRIITSDHKSISDRRKLQYTGSAHVSIALDEDGRVLGQPKLDTIGLFDLEDEFEQQIDDELYDEIIDILNEMSNKTRKDDALVEEEIRIGVRRFVFHMLGIKPKTTVHILRVD